MKYTFLKLLGKGSFAEVFLAIDKNTSNKVAIKRFRRHVPDIKKSFNNELEISKMIMDKKCPYIIKILDFYKDRDFYYMVMEYAPYGDLESFIEKSFKKRRSGAISEKIIDRIILQVNEALDTLHKNKIVHRDIKSSNILIFDKNTIKITDFGVSKILKNQVFTKSSIGTPYYMSPAIIKGEFYSFNVDYWAFGCLIYKLVTNQYPFEANNIPNLAKKIKNCKFEEYNIPLKYLTLIRNLLNPKNEKINEYISDISIKEREDQINNFISYNCESFIKSPTKLEYFKKKTIYSKYFIDDDSSEEKEIFNENNLSPCNSNILPPIKKLDSPPSNNITKNDNPYRKKYPYVEKANQLPKMDYNYNRDHLLKLNNHRKFEYNHVDNIDRNLYNKFQYKHPKVYNRLNPINHRFEQFHNPNYYYEKKNNFFTPKNFIEENKRNINRLNRINRLVEKKSNNSDLIKIINDSSLKKVPKKYLQKIYNGI